jgi:hypothetical protein
MLWLGMVFCRAVNGALSTANRPAHSLARAGGSFNPALGAIGLRRDARLRSAGFLRLPGCFPAVWRGSALPRISQIYAAFWEAV